MNRITIGFAAVATVLGAGGGAQAAFTGLTIELHATTTPAQTGGLTHWVWRAYANFDDPDDRLTGVFGNAQSPFTLTTTGTFHNVDVGVGGGNAPANAATLASFPNAEWDSFMSIGLAPGYQGPAGGNILVISPGGTIIAGSGVEDLTNVAWATAGPLPQGTPDAGGRVLIMQLTTDVPTTPYGRMGVNYLLDGTMVTQGLNQVLVPAPGAAVLMLVAAGAVASRRRRA